MHVPLRFVLGISLLLTTLPAFGQILDIDTTIRRSDPPEVVRGPVTLRLTNLNKVRYRVSVGQKVAFADGPDLGLAAFIPPIDVEAPVAPADAGAAAASPAPSVFPGRAEDGPPPPAACPSAVGDVEQRFAALHNCVSKESVQVQNLVAGAERARETLNARAKQLRDLVAEADQKLLADDGAALLAGQVKDTLEGLAEDLASAKADWPTIRQLAEHRQALESLREGLANLRFASDWSTWIATTENYVRFRGLEETVDELLTVLSELAPDSELGKSYADLSTNLKAWQEVLAKLDNKTAYETTIEVKCGFPFFQEKKVDYTLTLVDRTITDPAKNKSVEPLVQVVCPSHFTVSGGIAASGLVEQDYDFVSQPDGMGGLVNKIDVVNEGDEQINPTVLISTRLGSWSWDDKPGAIGYHLSAGTVADYDNPDGGLKFGYVLGLSASFMDDFLLTGGVQASRVGELADGFAVGDAQPMGLDEVPVTKEWRFDWVLGITYKLGGD